MSTKIPLGLGNQVCTGDDAGGLRLNVFSLDLANPQVIDAATPQNGPAKLTAPAANDLLQIGVVPAGEVLVPQLCNLRVPIVDTNGSPTGSFQLGTLATANALLGTTLVNAASSQFGEDFTLTTGPIGADNADTPIYMKWIAIVATLAVTGKIVFEQITRPFQTPYDGASTS